MASPRPTLTEACAPVFLYLTTFRRNAATSSTTIQGLHAALQREVERVRARCEEDRKLGPLFERIWYALVVTADQIVLSSTWPQRAGWSMQLLEAHYFKTLEGGKKFYRLVDEVLNDPTDEAAELAELLFTCMALGFQGELLGERRELEKRRRMLFEKARLPGRLGDVLTPSAYNRNAARPMAKLPTANIMKLALVALGAILFALLAGKGATELSHSKVSGEIEGVLETLSETGR